MSEKVQKLKDVARDLRVLYVEDDQVLREQTLQTLKIFFKRVDAAPNGVKALELYKKHKHNLVFSDILMPKMDGIEMSKEMLSINPDQKIIITSAYGDINYLTELINIGVDGFLPKPLVLEQAIDVLLKVSLEIKNIHYITDGFSYDKVQDQYFLNDESLDFSPLELRLLELFIKHPNEYFTNEAIYDHLFFDEDEKAFSIDSIKSIIKRIRKKIPSEIITNVKGVGYGLKVSK